MPTFTREDVTKMQVATNLKTVISTVPNMLGVQDVKKITVEFDMQTEALSYRIEKTDGTVIE